MNEKIEELKSDSRIRDAVYVALASARRFSTNLAILKDGKVMEVTPDEYEQGLSKQK